MTTCSRCEAPLDETVPGWCPSCRTAHRVDARTLATWLLPDGLEVAVDQASPRPPDPLVWKGYDELRTEAASESGVDESVIVVDGRIAGSDVRVVAVVWDFGYLGGSMGTVAGRRISGAFDHARDEGLPVVLLPSTGGARMQEGMASLVQMAATSVAATAHARAGLLQVTVLRDPTTGGVFASHANLAHVVLAEPGATIGFAGPRVAEAMTGGPLPEGSHTPRGALAAGLVDAIVDRPDLPEVLARWCAWPPRGSYPTYAIEVATHEPSPPSDPWREVERSRASDRARAPEFLTGLEVVGEFHGDRAGADDRSIRVVAAKLEGRPILVLAMDRTHGGRITPAGYRKAWRAIELAEDLEVDALVTLVDTPGADAGAASEAGGIASHIARTFRKMLTARVATVALVIGEGGSGGALALSVTDRLLIQEHATFSVIAPEGAAAILHRDPSRAAEVAEKLDPTAHRLHALGIADVVVPEPTGMQVAAGWAEVARAVDTVGGTPVDMLLPHRLQRWRRGWQMG